MIMSVVWCTVEPLLPSVNTAFCRTGNGPIRPLFPWAGPRTRLVTAPRLRPAHHPKPTRWLRAFAGRPAGRWRSSGSSDLRTCTTVRSVERSRSPRRPHSTMIAASGAALPAITFHGVMDRTAPCRRSDSAGSACDVGDEPVEVRVMPRPFRRRGPRWKEARGRLRLTRGRRPASPRRLRRPARFSPAGHQARSPARISCSCAGPVVRARRPRGPARGSRPAGPRASAPGLASPAGRTGGRRSGGEPVYPVSSRRAASGGRCAAELRSSPSNSSMFPSFSTNPEAPEGLQSPGPRAR